MKTYRKIKIVIPILLIMLFFTGCRAGKEHFELTNYMGRTASSFARRTELKLEEESSGVYVIKDVVQVMAPEGKVTAITLMKNAGDYTIYGIKINMGKAEAQEKIASKFGAEISKSINSTVNSVTYTYTNKEQELYVSYDIDSDNVSGVSLYELGEEKKSEDTAGDLNSGELIALIGDSRVYYNEAMVYLKSAQDKYEAEYGNTIWDADIMGNGETFGQMLKDEVIKQITELKIIRKKAEEEGITLTEEETAEAKSYAREHYEGLTSQDINKYLVTQELLERVYEDNLLADKVFENKTIDVDTNVPDSDAKQITVQDILVYSTDYDENGNMLPFSAEEKAEAYEKVKNLLEKAKTTEDFYALAEANSQGKQIEYTFGRGEGPKEFSSAFEQAAFTLKTGQVSDIISTDYGWHIIYCVSDFNQDATTQVKEKIIEKRRNDIFTKLYSRWAVDFDVVVNTEAWDAVPFED